MKKNIELYSQYKDILNFIEVLCDEKDIKACLAEREAKLYIIDRADIILRNKTDYIKWIQENIESYYLIIGRNDNYAIHPRSHLVIEENNKTLEVLPRPAFRGCL